ncbi:metal-dependent transcriptional regulator [Oerskovia sp. KBS0722]|nr:metal-dependent transcriptional regulator [Oerskovia sp. KBS0722]
MSAVDHPLDLTSVAQDYLKVVWSAQEWSDEPVTTKLLADRLGVGASTVSETVRRLSSQGLLVHARYGAIELTDLGRSHAVAMVRRHRILETYLVSELGYSWDEVHDEAEVLEHAVSDLMLDRIDALLGHPTRDPHGDPIPTASGHVPRPAAVRLSELDAGACAVVARISDSDPDVLRYLAELGLGLDAEVCVQERREYAGTMAITWGSDERPVHLGLPAASRVWVVPQALAAGRAQV